MKNTVRACGWIAAACGLLLAAGAPAAARTPRAGYGGDGISGNDIAIKVQSVADCSKRAAWCVNGSVDSGNVSNAQNVHIGGNANNSGNADYLNGSTNSHNETHGAYSKSDDDMQMLGRTGDQHL